MTSSDRKIVEFLERARQTERELGRVLETEIALAPGGDYRRELQLHLRQTREHAHALRRRLETLGRGRSTAERLIGGLVSRGVRLAVAPLGLLARTPSCEPQEVLLRAQDACAAEAAGIATYTAMERLARRAGDATTADLAHQIREQEQQMFERLQAHLPSLTDTMVAADVDVDVHHCNVKVVELDDARRERARLNLTTHVSDRR
jgi:ferritin-like metal-binding protein YciE